MPHPGVVGFAIALCLLASSAAEARCATPDQVQALARSARSALW